MHEASIRPQRNAPPSSPRLPPLPIKLTLPACAATSLTFSVADLGAEAFVEHVSHELNVFASLCSQAPLLVDAHAGLASTAVVTVAAEDIFGCLGL